MKIFVESLKREKKYIIFALALFSLSFLYGVLFFDSVSNSLKQAGFFERIEQVTQTIEQSPTLFTAFSTIFTNNVSASLMAIGFGLFFGLIPMMMLISNGLILGVALMDGAIQSGVHPFLLFVTSILPHGIFELPAIFIGAALGIHLGMAVARLIKAIFIQNQREKSMAEWKGIGRRFFVIASGMVTFLFVAAVIEAGLIIWILTRSG